VQYIQARIPDLLVASLLILRCAFAQVPAACIDALDCHRILENAVVWLHHYLLYVHGSFKHGHGSYCNAHQHGSHGDKPKYCCVLPSRESMVHHYLRLKVKVSGFPWCLLAKVAECRTESAALSLAQFSTLTFVWCSVLVWFPMLLGHLSTRLESAMASIFDNRFCLAGMKSPWLCNSPNSIVNGWYAHVKPPWLYNSHNSSINSWYNRVKPPWLRDSSNSSINGWYPLARHDIVDSATGYSRMPHPMENNSFLAKKCDAIDRILGCGSYLVLCYSQCNHLLHTVIQDLHQERTRLLWFISYYSRS
jgi:hypothetical protein